MPNACQNRRVSYDALIDALAYCSVSTVLLSSRPSVLRACQFLCWLRREPASRLKSVQLSVHALRRRLTPHLQ
jgi:hypothetical protein